MDTFHPPLRPELVRASSATLISSVCGTQSSKHGRRRGSPMGSAAGGGEGSVCLEGEPSRVKPAVSLGSMPEPGGERAWWRDGSAVNAGWHRRAGVASVTSPLAGLSTIIGVGFCSLGGGGRVGQARMVAVSTAMVAPQSIGAVRCHVVQA
jgi:hypothetical protein